MTAPRGALARALYATLLRLLQPAYLARLWWRGRAEPLYRHALGERVGRYVGAVPPGALWLHAVSLGETRAAAALVDELRRLKPGLRLLLTHGTATGREAGRALLHEGDLQAWLPYDTPGAAARFFDHFRPALGVLLETEIWPNLLHEAQRRALPVVLANARLSERSAGRGRRLDALMRPAVHSLALVLAQTGDDARRLQQAGAQTLAVCGNLKFDMAPDESLLARGRAWRAALGRPVLLAAVTREGEEAMLLDAWAARADSVSEKPLLLVVPRHPQRFDEVAELIRSRGLGLARRSAWGDTPSPDARGVPAWLGDSMREMPLYYGMADAALLGGSFAPLGGQNLIEAAACACPVVMGPHTFNFAEAATLAEEAGAATRVADIGAGLDAALALIADPVRQAEQARRSRDFAAAHRGAARRMAEAIVARLAAPR